MGKRHRWLLCAIVLGAAALSTYWVFLVPIYQSPDEPLHLDYALGLHSHGRLYGPGDWTPPRLFNRAENIFTHEYVHPLTNYLMDQTGAGTIAFNAPAKVAPDYGSPEFFQRLDSAAPTWESVEVQEAPFLFGLYPFGYYSVLAGWIEILRRLCPQISFVFFGARLLSVVLLAGTLLFTYGTLRALRVSRAVSLAITAGVGFFPLTSFISSYVQPDNLSLLLTSACFYLSLQIRRRTDGWRNYALLGLALGGLIVTKAHYFVAIAVSIAGMLAGAVWVTPLSWLRRLCYGCLLTLPAVGLGFLQAKSQGHHPSLFQPPPVKLSPAKHVAVWTGKALKDYYLGLTHRSFWGNFGWLDTPLVIHDALVTRCVGYVLTATAILFFVLSLARAAQVARRIGRVARHGRWRSAWRVAFSNPVLNSYFAFTVLMIVLYVYFQNVFGAQGRNWLPFLLPFFLTGVAFVPRLFRRPRVRWMSAAAVLTALLTFDGIGSYYALATIKNRYYAPYHGQVLRHVALMHGCHSMCEKQPHSFAPEAPQFARGLRLQFVFTHSEQLIGPLRMAWCKSDGRTQETVINVIHDRSVQTLTVPVEATVERITLEMGGNPSRLDVFALELLCR